MGLGSDGNAVTVKMIHEHDQFQQQIAPSEFSMTHSIRAPYGDFWSVTVPIAGSPLRRLARHGDRRRYLYRYRIDNPQVGSLDGLSIPAPASSVSGSSRRSHSVISRILGAPRKVGGRVPELADLVLYEMNIAEFGGRSRAAHNLMAYLATSA